ncbi:hypothetical protein SYNPCC7002_G0050 (plasmid) [Picosynechococcus sp. PCC 7002]|nr:hypothetical protein SYNPCC7002_G0050 [Picosynechococcus sp. PCC 7002]
MSIPQLVLLVLLRLLLCLNISVLFCVEKVSEYIFGSL